MNFGNNDFVGRVESDASMMDMSVISLGSFTLHATIYVIVFKRDSGSFSYNL